MSKVPYNRTDLDPLKSFEKHVFHRDQFAHYLRWTHVLKNLKKHGEVVVDFGAGKSYLLEVMWRNHYHPERYIALEYRGIQVVNSGVKYKDLEYADFYQQDIIHPTMDYSKFNATTVVSFEVAEHVGKQNLVPFLENFMTCGGEDARYYLSTPNYDEFVGAAGNHTYDSGDGRGVAVQEHDHYELQQAILDTGFEIVNKFGTFASQRDYVGTLNECERRIYDALHEYYDPEVLATVMAPIIEPELARNCLWVLKRS